MYIYICIIFGAPKKNYASKDFADPSTGFEDFWVCFSHVFWVIILLVYFGSSTWLGSKGVTIILIHNVYIHIILYVDCINLVDLGLSRHPEPENQKNEDVWFWLKRLFGFSLVFSFGFKSQNTKKMSFVLFFA